MNTDKELYRKLRGLSCDALWTEEVPRFNRASPAERIRRVAVIRAVGVAFSMSGSQKQKAEARAWLSGLLRDPGEKIRRYAMAALPKLGAGAGEEATLLSLLQSTPLEREKKYVGRALDKIGGTASLELTGGLSLQTEQKVKASVARRQSPSVIRMESALSRFADLLIHLRCRAGLETIVRDEVKERIGPRGKFRLAGVRQGVVAIIPVAPFSLADLYALRCFATVNFALGVVRAANAAESVERLATVITSGLSQYILTSLTDGPIRYRLDFVSKGHQRGAVRLVTNRAYALCPEILNDARSAPWAVEIHPAGRDTAVELRPRISPDPRFSYRRGDVPAASHPSLAACMARLAGRMDREIAWDPFCGSGLELIERALLGGVQRLYGTDVSPDAIAVARANLAAANLKSVSATFACCDFRDFAKVRGLDPESVTLVITNPPMGKRIQVRDLRGLMESLFAAASVVLKPGGRLVFVNPVRVEPRRESLELQFRERVDLGGFDGRLEVYRKPPRGTPA